MANLSENAKQVYELLGLHTNPDISVASGFTYQGMPVEVILQKANTPMTIHEDGTIYTDYETIAIIVNPNMVSGIEPPTTMMTSATSLSFEGYQEAVANKMMSDDYISDPEEVITHVSESLIDEVMDGLAHETFDYFVESPRKVIEELIHQIGKKKMVVLADSIYTIGMDESKFTWLPLTKDNIQDIPFFDLCVVVEADNLEARYQEQLKKELLIKSNIHAQQAVVVYLADYSKGIK